MSNRFFLEPEMQNTNFSYPEDDLTTLYPFLKRCHEYDFRNLNDDEWNNFISGHHAAIPSNYLDVLKDKNLFLIHGSVDKSIRPYHTESFYKKLKDNGAQKAKLLIGRDFGHGKSLRLGTKEKWIEWLNKLFY